MAQVKTKKTSWLGRILWALLAIFVLLILCVIALRIFITTAPGARVIENQINKRSFGAIESVNVSGLSGDPLNAISIENLEIKDKDGVWLRVQNLDLEWKPFAFFKDHIWVKNLAIAKTDVLRRPNLNATEGGGDPLKITLETFDLAAVNLNESLVGQALSLESSGHFIAQPSGAIKANLNAARLDALGDTIALDFTRTDAGDMTGLFDVKGAANGSIATLLKAPEGAAISGTGTLAGTDVQGDGTVVISFGDTETVLAKALWTAAEIDANATLNLEGWPALDPVKARLGSTLQSRLNVNRQAAPQTFTANINVPGLSVDADGNLPENGFIPAEANIDFKADKVSTYIPIPDGYAAGSASATGRIDLAEPYGFDGRITVANINTPYGSAKQVTGPAMAAQDGTDRYTFKTDFIVDGVVTTANIPVNLAAKTQLKSSGNLNMDMGRLTFQSFDLTSGPNKITGKGTLTTDAQSLDLNGRGTAAIKAQGSIPEGIVKADFALSKTPGSLIAITADGAFRPSAPMVEPLGGLIGEQLVFKTKMSPVDQGLRISEASVVGDNARAAIAGTFGDQLDLSGEAVLSAPLIFKSVMIDDGAEGSFALTGTPASPTLRVDATARSIAVQNYSAENVRLRAELTDLLDAPKGPVQVEADTKQGPLTASTQFASTTGTYVANDIDLTWGRLTAGGTLQYPDDGIATGQVNLRLPEREGQYARAGLTLTNASGEQGIGLTADAKQIALAGFQFKTVAAEANGTLASLAGTVKAEGQHGDTLIARQFNIDTPFTLIREPEQTYTATANPEASYGDIGVTARMPINATYNSGDFSLNAPLTVSDGTVDVVYQRSSDQEQFKLDAKLLPVTLVPMPGNLADTRGRVSADIDVSVSDGAALQGGGTVTLTDWRGFDVDKGKGVAGTLRADINGAAANMTLTASSPAGFKSDGQLNFPLSSTGALTSTRLNMDAPISGKFTASGAASSIFGLMTPSDAELGGTLSANITIAGTASNPRVEGQAGGQDIRFEVPELGTRIRKGRATATFTNDSFAVSDLFVADADDGTLTGAGEFKLGELGRPIGEIRIEANQFRALDRKDVEGKVKGSLKFVSTAKDATLSGDVTINRAEVKQFVTGSVGVIEIEVEEINRPDQDDKIAVNAPATPINLDVRVRAPRRVFIRSRGLDVELSVDATIKGTLTEPEFYGEAKVLRGGYKLAGKTLDFESGTIKFDGDLASAKVDFKAVTETQNLDASVTIKGTVEAPEIELSSTPERPQDEILSALLFGRSATELSTIEAAQLAGALAQFSGKGGGFDLLGGLRDAFGIGQLSVNFNPDGSAQLVGGRYLAKDVYLQVFSGAGPDQSGAIIDWEIRKNIALRSRIRADNDQALSLKWKRDF